MLTSPVHLPLDRLHAPGLLDDVIDELRGLLVPHLIFGDAGLRQQLRQVGVQVVGIPADVSDMPGWNVVAELKKTTTTTMTTTWRDGARRLASDPHLNPQGAPMSALESLVFFFLFLSLSFLSFFPLLLTTGAVAGEGTER